MKLKRILVGALATALVLTSMPVSGLVASADQGSVGAEHGIEKSGYVYQRVTSDLESWKVSTDAGTDGSTDITNILKDDDKWVSADTVETTVSDQDGHPVKDITLAKNNNFYLKLATPESVGRLVYYICNRQRNGKILKANVYVSTETKDVSTVDELKTLNWKLVASDEEERAEGDNSGEYTPTGYEYKFKNVEENVKYVRFEALKTGIGYNSMPNTLITCYELELYSDNTTELASVTDKKIDSTKLTAYTDFKTHNGDAEGPAKVLDGQLNGDNGGGKCCSIEFGELDDENYLDYPVQTGYVKNNNIFLTMDEAKNLAMLTYVSAERVGSVRDARIYLSNKDVAEGKDVGVAEENVKGDATVTQKDDWTKELSEGWVKVYDGEEQWARWNENPKANNGHSVYWKPMMAKHVRVEIEHTYGAAYNGGASANRDTKINAKRIILYEGVKSVDVTRQEENQTKVVAFSGYLNETDMTENSVDKLFDNKEDGSHDHDTAWNAGPALKGDGANGTDVPYIVLDLGEGTRTLVDAVSIFWDAERYATKYAVLTTDDLTETDITKGQATDENHWSDKVLNDPPKLDGEGSGFENLEYDETKWQMVRTQELSEGGQDDTSFDGAKPDNAYFVTTKSEELKRYVCLVALDMSAEASEDGIAIKCAAITGAKRKVTPIKEAKVDIVQPVANEAPEALARESADFTIVNVQWTDDTGAVVTQFPDEETMKTHTYTVSATLKPDPSKIFTKDTEIIHSGIDQGRMHIHGQTLNEDDTMDITHTFMLEEVSDVNVTATLPEAGTKVQNAVEPTSSDSTKYTVEKYEWCKGDADETVSTDTFEAGTTYKLKVTLAATDKYYFAANEKIAVKIAGKDATVEKNEDGRLLTAYVSFALISSVSELHAAADEAKETAEAADAATTYTQDTLSALKKAIYDAEKLQDGASSDDIQKAMDALVGALDALRKKIAAPSLSVKKPAFDAAPENVTSNDANANYTAESAWAKVDGGKATEMKAGDKFGKGTYRLTVKLTPKADYAFEDSTKPTAIKVKDGGSEETQTVSSTVEKGVVTLTCEFEVSVECTCAITDIKVKVDGEETTEIDMGDAAEKEVTLTGEATLAACKDPDHKDREVRFTFAKKDVSGDVIKEIKDDKMTVVKAGEETVVVTAKLADDDSVEKSSEVTFTVKKNAGQPADEKALEELRGGIEAAQKAIEDKDQGDFTNKSRSALAQALQDAQEAADRESPMKDEVAAAQSALDDIVGAIESEEAFASLKKATDILNSADYTTESWAALQDARKAAQDVQTQWTAEDSAMTAKEYAARLAEKVTALQAAKDGLKKKAAAEPTPGTPGTSGTPGTPGTPGNQTADNLPKVGAQYQVGKLIYSVKTSTATSRTVSVVKVKTSGKKVTVPATVKIGGYDYSVTEIKANAFAKNKKLTQVTIGKNVVTIGKKAFFGCQKLKKVQIKATGLKKIGRQAFGKINKKAKLYVPKKQYSALKKKLKKAKTIKSAKILKK